MISSDGSEYTVQTELTFPGAPSFDESRSPLNFISLLKPGIMKNRSYRLSYDLISSHENGRLRLESLGGAPPLHISSLTLSEISGIRADQQEPQYCMPTL